MATGPFSTTATASSYSTAATLADGTNVAVGLSVTGEGIPVGTTVSAISGTSLTLSAKTLDVLGSFTQTATGVGPLSTTGTAAGPVAHATVGTTSSSASTVTINRLVS